MMAKLSSVAWFCMLGASAVCCALGAHDHAEHIQETDPTRALAPSEPPTREGTLKIATWNLAWLNRTSGRGPVARSDADYARLRSYAQRLDADVIALQEVDGPEAAARVFAETDYAFHVAARGDAQRAGFAYRRGLAVTVHPDYDALDVGQLRAGADLSIELGGRKLRLLSVHLKSGCFAAPLTSSSKDCSKLRAQLPALEAWIDQRALEGSAAIVLGDFNRRLFARGDAVWAELDDGEPAASDLWSPTEGVRARCWEGEYPEFVDHIVLNAPARRWLVAGSFEELVYDARDAAAKRTLSDHCPLALRLDAAAGAPSSDPALPATTFAPDAAPPSSTAALTAAAPRTATVLAPAAPEVTMLRIKGNLGARGRKIYHAPGCPDYARTQIDEGKGERWFDSAAEAEAAGFLRANNCRR